MLVARRTSQAFLLSLSLSLLIAHTEGYQAKCCWGK